MFLEIIDKLRSVQQYNNRISRNSRFVRQKSIKSTI